MSKNEYKFCNLYSFVKKHNVDLYNILEDMCAIGLFRPKHPVTFINPNSASVKKLSGLIDSGKSDVAFEELQKFFIYGKHKDLKKADLITYNSKLLKSKVAEMTKPNDKFKGWDNRDNVSVFDQTSGDLLEEGEARQRPKLEKKPVVVKGKGETGDERMKATKKLLQLSSDDGVKIEHVFARHVNGLLVHLQEKDESKFKEVRHYIDPNPVLCWYLLVKPSCDSSSLSESSNYISDDIFLSWFNSMESNINNRSAKLLRELFSDDGYDKSKLAEASKKRNGLETDGCDKTAQSIISSYENNRVRLLEDELRFRFSDSDLSADSDSINELNHVDWCNPDDATILFKNFEGSLCTSAVHNLMLNFKDSNAFHYCMFDESIHKKLENNIMGAGAGAKKILKIFGSKARKLVKKIEDSDEEEEMNKFISSLNKKQVSSLKKMMSKV